jgi:hypothetical protein
MDTPLNTDLLNAFQTIVIHHGIKSTEKTKPKQTGKKPFHSLFVGWVNCGVRGALSHKMWQKWDWFQIVYARPCPATTTLRPASGHPWTGLQAGPGMATHRASLLLISYVLLIWINLEIKSHCGPKIRSGLRWETLKLETCFYSGQLF